MRSQEQEHGLTEGRILHFDLDAFFAAVEVLLDPSLVGKPLIVGAEPGKRGVVSTASYEARAFGVRSAMPIAIAQRLCPQAVFRRPQFHAYREYSHQVFGIVRRYSDRVEEVSIDEAFVELAEQPESTAREIRKLIREETGLTASMGLSTAKIVSKIASDFGKPDGFVVVPPGEEASFLAPLPVRQLWGVGPKMALRLADLGIATIGDLAAAERTRLVGALGRRQAEMLLGFARGVDHSRVEPGQVARSISEEITFERDVRDARLLWRVLRQQCADCARKLSVEDALARTVTLKLRYGDFRTVTRSLSLTLPTDEEQAFLAAAAALMRRAWARDRRPLRLIGLRLSGFRARPGLRQLPLFDDFR